MKRNQPTVADIATYDEIIDVRSPAEFAEDHIPGAINCPVLDDAQRAQVGTIYKQISPFEAKKIGAALISENIARHLRVRFLDKPKNWRPLIYCWRGGERSGAMTTVFRSIGWSAGQLDGGYKAWRAHVIAQLADLPQRYRFIVLCGATGNAKTRVLQAIGQLGEQILDLETLASHKGSVLGVLPDQPQPSQKAFESALLTTLAAHDPSRPIYVEAESRKIGNLHVPETLIARIRGGACVTIEASLDARVRFLRRDYDYFLSRPDFLCNRLDVLRHLQSREIIERWHHHVSQADWDALIRELLELHYDPLYRRSQNTNFSGLQAPPTTYLTDSLDETGILQLAERIVHGRPAQIA